MVIFLEIEPVIFDSQLCCSCPANGYSFVKQSHFLANFICVFGREWASLTMTRALKVLIFTKRITGMNDKMKSVTADFIAFHVLLRGSYPLRLCSELVPGPNFTRRKGKELNVLDNPRL